MSYIVENAMAGLPQLDYTRSLSRYGLSQVTVVFEDGTDIYFARQLVAERIEKVKNALPSGLSPEMGPIATGLGEIFMFTVDADPAARRADGKPYDAYDLHDAMQWIVKPQLAQVDGVTEVNSIGGYERQLVVAPQPSRLLAYGLSLKDLTDALEANNANRGAGYIEQQGAQVLIRSPGQFTRVDEVKRVVIRRVDGAAVTLGEVAEVGWGSALRTGAATMNGREVVLGTVFMLIGENSREVARAVGDKLVEIQRSLPAGIEVRAVYDRTRLVDKTLQTIQKT